MSNRLFSDDHHYRMVEEGMKYIELEIPEFDKILWEFSSLICLNMIKALGPKKIAHEFSLQEYEDPEFVQHLSLRIEFGVPVLIIKVGLYSKFFNSSKLLPLVSALNYNLSCCMAEVFDKLKLRKDTTPSVYSNKALSIIVNRTMGRFEELNLIELTKYTNLL